jgi:hypothetical protein
MLFEKGERLLEKWGKGIKKYSRWGNLAQSTLYSSMELPW